MAEKKDEDEEISIDFSKIKNFFRKKEKRRVKALESDEKQLAKEVGKEIKGEKAKSDELKKDKKVLDKLEHEMKKEEKEAEKIDAEKSRLDRDIKETRKEIEKVRSDVEKEDDDISFDFSKVKKWFRGHKSVSHGKMKEESSEEDEISVDWGKVGGFFKRYSAVFLLLIPLFLAVFFRMYPAYLPITDDWAESSVYNFYKNQISAQVSSEFPNLPDANKQALIDTEFSKFLEESKDGVEQQTAATSEYFKSQYKYTGTDGKEHLYLSDIDTYLWYGEAKNYLKYGHFGTEVVDGKEINFLRNGREGLEMPPIKLHTLFEVYLYKLVSLFNRNVQLTTVIFGVSVIIIALSIIPAFFIGRRLAGNVGGLFAGIIVAINSALLARTSASVADTDPWNILFPLIILWLFIEAFEAKNRKMQIIYSLLAGLSVGLFSFAWGGWWYPFDFIISMLFVYLAYLLIARLFKKEDIKVQLAQFGIIGGIFLFTSAVFVSLFSGIKTFYGAFTGPISIIFMKSVGVFTLWPNVMTTVAEFNEVPLSNIVGQMGGSLFFWIGLMGMVLLLFNKGKKNQLNWAYLALSALYYLFIIGLKDNLNNPLTFMTLISIPIVVGVLKIIYLSEFRDIDVKLAIVMIIWFMGTAYGFTRGIRFSILMVPAFAVSFGVSIGVVYNMLAKWVPKELKINKTISDIVIVLLLCLLFVGPVQSAHSTAKNEVILMNDAWYDSLIKIKNDSTDAIITSWWDFGHWFVAVAERRVTSDGADQGERIHWVGKSLLTSDEDVSMGLLRMLNCGQEKAPHILEKYMGNDTVKAVDILNKIILEDRAGAEDILKAEGLKDSEIKEVLDTTHCSDLIPQYYITSEDMVGKAAVWGHFGSWDFERAKMYLEVHDLSHYEGIRVLTEEFNFSEDEAETMYNEIISNEGDQWISPWPSYMSGETACSVNGDIVKCPNSLEINLTDHDAYFNTQDGKKHPASLVYAAKTDLVEKKFDDSIPYSVILIPKGDSYDMVLCNPLLANSMFTRLFYFDGHGSTHFTKFSDVTSFTGDRIIIWKVSWTPGEKSVMDDMKDKYGVYYTGWLENGTVFDSSIKDWKSLNITKDSDLDSYENNVLTFTSGAGQLIPGFDNAVSSMSVGDTKTVRIAPEDAYGTDPAAHELGNKTLYFKIKVVDIS
jgi:asparagine N-glycosylation enzyme membrane subunit Stt3